MIPGRLRNRLPVHMFRFHTGSIKSSRTHTHLHKVIRCFDSILVRLKDAQLDFLESEECEFRFHTGSIKRLANALAINRQAVFRFHTGSIKSHRLEIHNGIYKFRFHTGSIKRQAIDAAVRLETGFDSILVRLKDSCMGRLNTKQPVSIPYWFD